MMEGVRAWILSVLAAALLLSMLESAMPDGPVRKVGRLAVGLALFLVILRPALSGLPDWVGASWQEEVQAASAYPDDLEQANEIYLETVMSQRAAEYIVTQAALLGADVEAAVACAWSEGLPLPASAEITGSVPDGVQTQLVEIIETDLGISPAQITFREAQP